MHLLLIRYLFRKYNRIWLVPHPDEVSSQQFLGRISLTSVKLLLISQLLVSESGPNMDSKVLHHLPCWIECGLCQQTDFYRASSCPLWYVSTGKVALMWLILISYLFHSFSRVTLIYLDQSQVHDMQDNADSSQMATHYSLGCMAFSIWFDNCLTTALCCVIFIWTYSHIRHGHTCAQMTNKLDLSPVLWTPMLSKGWQIFCFVCPSTRSHRLEELFNCKTRWPNTLNIVLYSNLT